MSHSFAASYVFETWFSAYRSFENALLILQNMINGTPWEKRRAYQVRHTKTVFLKCLLWRCSSICSRISNANRHKLRPPWKLHLKGLCGEFVDVIFLWTSSGISFSRSILEYSCGVRPIEDCVPSSSIWEIKFGPLLKLSPVWKFVWHGKMSVWRKSPEAGNTHRRVTSVLGSKVVDGCVEWIIQPIL